jgi:hypothetical protein
MATAQITLTQTESEALQALARCTGKSTEQLLHEAVERYLAQAGLQNRRQLLRSARGIWKDRQDLPDLKALRKEWDRFGQ